MSAYLLEFARDDGFGGFVRFDLRDGAPHVWYWTYLVNVPGFEGIVAVRDHEVAAPRQRLEVRAEGLWAELWCEAPGEHWTFGLEAFGVVLEDPDDARRPGGEIGERIPVGLDLEWETPETVHGEVLIGRERVAVDGRGRFLETHELGDVPVSGEEVARVVIPLEASDFLERTLHRASDGLRWGQRVTRMQG